MARRVALLVAAVAIGSWLALALVPYDEDLTYPSGGGTTAFPVEPPTSVTVTLRCEPLFQQPPVNVSPVAGWFTGNPCREGRNALRIGWALGLAFLLVGMGFLRRAFHHRPELPAGAGRRTERT